MRAVVLARRLRGRILASRTQPLPRPRTAAISYVSPLLAVIVGVLHAALAPVIVVGGAKPNLVLVATVLVTTSLGFLPGITWAFVAGAAANLLVGDPLGSVPLTLLLVAVLVAGGGRALGGMVWVYPVLATFAGSVIADLVSLVLAQVATGSPVVGDLPMDLVLRAALLNAGVAALLTYPMRVLTARYATQELRAW